MGDAWPFYTSLNVFTKWISSISHCAFNIFLFMYWSRLCSYRPHLSLDPRSPRLYIVNRRYFLVHLTVAFLCCLCETYWDDFHWQFLLHWPWPYKMNPDVLSDGQKKWRPRQQSCFWQQCDGLTQDGSVQSFPLQDLLCCCIEMTADL